MKKTKNALLKNIVGYLFIISLFIGLQFLISGYKGKTDYSKSFSLKDVPKNIYYWATGTEKKIK